MTAETNHPADVPDLVAALADRLRAAAREAFAPCGGTGLDSPFAGTYVPLEYYGTEPRVEALMIELRRDTYMEEPGGPAGPGLDRLAAALATLVDAL